VSGLDVGILIVIEVLGSDDRDLSWLVRPSADSNHGVPDNMYIPAHVNLRDAVSLAYAVRLLSARVSRVSYLY
jgi:hypothetical protein